MIQKVAIMFVSFYLLGFWISLTAEERLDSKFVHSHGHYPSAYCQFSDVVFSPSERAFLYQSSTPEHDKCASVTGIWTLKDVASLSLDCDKVFDSGHVFTIYYWYSGSNYFHLHYDMMIPLYQAVHYNGEPDNYEQKRVFMPTVESTRLKPVDWNTRAFDNYSKFWIQMSELISAPFDYYPLNDKILKADENICFKQIYFGTPSVSFSDSDLIRGFVRHVQRQLNITEQPYKKDRIGIISRSNRRRILNEDELISSLSAIVKTEKIEFSGMSYRDQVQMMQSYTILVGVNGAGLTNGLYLPSYAVAIQIVPYKAEVNYREFGALLKTRGSYLEWHNPHENLSRPLSHEKYNNSPDTIVHVEDFKRVIYEALVMVQKSKYALEKEAKKSREEL